VEEGKKVKKKKTGWIPLLFEFVVGGGGRGGKRGEVRGHRASKTQKPKGKVGGKRATTRARLIAGLMPLSG